MPSITLPARHRARWCLTPLAAALLAAGAPHAGAQTATPAAASATPAAAAPTPLAAPASADTPATRVIITGNPLEIGRAHV